jgi:hypothetical protein
MHERRFTVAREPAVTTAEPIYATHDTRYYLHARAGGTKCVVDARVRRTDMRFVVSLALATATLGWVGLARAQAPINPYDPPEPVAAPAPPPAVAPIPAQPAPIAPAVPPTPPVAPAPPAVPIDPYSAYPAPPAYGYQSPSRGPAQTASPPSYQQGYYLYSAPGQPPVYYAPPTSYQRCGVAVSCCGCPCSSMRRAVLRRRPDVRRFSLGAHVGFLTLNQQVGNDQVTVGGAGFQLRLRSSGRWGFEASQSFLHGSYWDGAWQRDMFPFQLSLMFYLFPNRDAHHFNLYGVAGIGLVADSVTLYDQNRRQVTQDFTELGLHAGLGAELRFRWFGIEADARYVSLWRDNSSVPAAYYGDVKGAPVQKSTYGVQGNVYLSIWF